MYGADRVVGLCLKSVGDIFHRPLPVIACAACNHSRNSPIVEDAAGSFVWKRVKERIR